MSALTSESEQPAEPGRKFDDIASLFGSIVPVPGTAKHPMRPFKPLSIPRPDAAPAAVIPAPSSPLSSAPRPELHEPVDEIAPEPEAMVSFEDLESELAALESSDAPIALRTRPQEIPWPDAFEPRPNYRKPEPRNWTWLLLIPVGLMAAFGVSVIDTRSLKGWIDTNVLHRTLIAAAPNESLLPVPFRTDATAAAAPTEAPNLTPALPTSPVPVPPGTEVSPPPPTSPAEAVVPPPIHVTIQYRRGVPGADGEARRMAALLQNTGGSVELHPNATTLKSPTIMFYNVADKNSAAGLAVTLANEAATWTVRQGAITPTSHTPPGSIDIWMP